MTEEQNKIDDIFKEAFDQYEVIPSKKVWKGIKQGHFKKNFKFSDLVNIHNIAYVLIAAGIGITILLLPSKKQKSNLKTANDTLSEKTINFQKQANNNFIYEKSYEKVTEENHSEISSYDTSHLATSRQKNIETSNELKTLKIKKQQKIITLKSKIENKSISDRSRRRISDKHKKRTVGKKTNEKIITTNFNEKKKIKHIINAIILDKEKDSKQKPFVKENKTKIKKLKPVSFKNFIKNIHAPEINSIINNSLLSDSYSKKYDLSLGAYFSPEIINNGTKPNKNSYTLGIDVNCNFSNYVLRSGIGVSYSEGNGYFKIAYEKYDSIGFYNRVNSFIVNPNNSDSIIFNTSIVNVYDSVQHTDDSQTKNYYTYLRFPFFVGNNVIDFKKISCTIYAGPVLSLLIYKNEPNLNFYKNDVKIINIDNNTPVRIKTIWQFQISVGFAYNLTDNLKISIEPTYRYYINSIYNSNYLTSKRPYSVGLRTGILFNF